MRGLVRSRPWGVDSVPSGRIGAGPHLSLLFREHLPHLVVTVLPPYAGAYLAGVLGILISQSQSCVMRPCWQARPGPVCAASRPVLATASVGAGPHRERQRCAEWKKPWHVFSLLLFGWGLLRLCGPGAASEREEGNLVSETERLIFAHHRRPYRDRPHRWRRARHVRRWTCAACQTLDVYINKDKAEIYCEARKQ